MRKGISQLELESANALIYHEEGIPLAHYSTNEAHIPLGYRGMYLTMCNPNPIFSVKIADNSDIDSWVMEHNYGKVLTVDVDNPGMDV